MDARSVRVEIEREGHALLPDRYDEPGLAAFAAELGEVVDDTWVRRVPGRHTYLASPDAIPFHTDHPRADLIAWRCESQDESDGASLLIDGARLLAELDAETRDELEQVVLPAMVRLGDPPEPTQVLRRSGERVALFFAPWLEPPGHEPAAEEALRRLRALIDREAPRARRFRLEPGQVLLVDNHRMLHGRARLLATSARKLHRLWLRADPTGLGVPR
jgi:hypothetical protein